MEPYVAFFFLIFADSSSPIEMSGILDGRLYESEAACQETLSEMYPVVYSQVSEQYGDEFIGMSAGCIPIYALIGEQV